MRRRGFTLVELVIAMFVAAIMFAIGYSAINQALRDRDGLETSQARVTEIQRGMRIVAQDFAQIIARPARDLQGTGDLVPALIAKGTGSTSSSSSAVGVELITFTRGGWSNPAGVQRPAEQRVRYSFVDGSLVRDHWLSVDPALNAEPRERVLFTKIKSVELRFLDPSSRTWRTEWPATASGSTSTSNPLTTDVLFRTRPLEIEITIVFEDWGRIMRIFEIPT